MPLFSIVIPTKDRPDFFEFAIQSVKNQDLDDYEVIVCDNFEKKSCKEVFDKYSDGRFNYIRPKEVLGMSDNWEYALSHAKGEYILFLIDKTVLFPNALSELRKVIIDKARPEVITFYSEMYNLFNSQDLLKGSHRNVAPFNPITSYEGKQIFRKKIEFSINRANEGVTYYYGKICFGAVKKDVVDNIKLKANCFFSPLSPDYYSMSLVLMTANSFIDIGKPLLMSFSGTGLSNGALIATYPKIAYKFIGTYNNHANIIENLPISKLYISVHNVVAYDYFQTIKKIDKESQYQINKENLILRAVNDWLYLDWQDDNSEKKKHYQILKKAIASLSFANKINVISVLFFYYKNFYFLKFKDKKWMKPLKMILNKKNKSGLQYRNYQNIHDAVDASKAFYFRKEYNNNN